MLPAQGEQVIFQMMQCVHNDWVQEMAYNASDGLNGHMACHK